MKLKLLLIITSSLITLISCSQNSTEPGPKVIGQGIGPRLTTGADGDLLLSYIESTEASDALVYLAVTPDGLGPKRIAASGDNWFVNWADFPSVTVLSDDVLAAHWLERQPAGGYAYDILAAFSTDAGDTWNEPFRLHNDGTETEHGFVSLYGHEDGFAAVWLDGRNMSGAHGHSDHGSGGMTLRGGSFAPDGTASNEQMIDGLTCDCCQTDVANSSSGPIAAYRDRSEDDIRDIYVARFENGAWSTGDAVHDDGWQISGCPVNGPAIEAVKDTVAVTWFTAAGGSTAVNAAWSHDAGRTFQTPLVLDNQKPLGYVGSAAIDNDAIVASWVCTQENGSHAICYRLVTADGHAGPRRTIASSNLVDRLSVPQVAKIGKELVFVWTERNEQQAQIVSSRIPLSSLRN